MENNAKWLCEKLKKVRRGSTEEHARFVGAADEITYDTDRDMLIVHDGRSPGGHWELHVELRPLHPSS